MRSSPDFQLKISKEINSSGRGFGITSIIICQPYAHREKELRGAFKGEDDVEVMVDRRYGERRKKKQPITLERRRSVRRRSKEDLLEVVIST